MMRIAYYSLRIDIGQEDEETIWQRVNSILGVSATSPLTHGWIYEMVEEEADPYFDFVNEFLDLIEGKYEQLATLEIYPEDITVWALHQYSEQFNTEFEVEAMRRLAHNGIKLCLSCWEN